MHTVFNFTLNRRFALPLLSFFLVFVIFLSTQTTTSNNGFDYDGRYYAAMAGEKGFTARFIQTPPWCYRILTPSLAAFLPWDILTNFKVIAFISNFLSLILLFQILIKLNFSAKTSALGLLLYSGVFWTLKFSFFSPAYIDYVTQLLLLLILFSALHARYLIVAGLLVAGALQKESLVLFSIFPVVHFWRTASIRHVSDKFLILLVPVVAVLHGRF